MKSIFQWLKTRNIRRQEKKDVMNIIKHQNQRLAVQIDKAVQKIETLHQDHLYFLYIECDDIELDLIKQQFSLVKQSMKWTVPNILILNRPLMDLTEKKLRELISTKKKLKRGV